MRWTSMLTMTLVLALPLSACAGPDTKFAPSAHVDPQVLRVSGSGTALPLVEKLAEAYQETTPQVRLLLQGGTNSGGAIRGVMNGTLDIGVANRPMTDGEREAPLTYVPFARDAVAFTVNEPNPVQALSRADIQGMFEGSITGWHELGGPASPIIVLDRDEDESMRKLVLLPLMNGREVKAKVVVLTSARDMLLALTNTPHSVGYSSLGLLNLNTPRNVRVLPVDDVMPSRDTVANDAYPWFLTFGLIHRQDAVPAVHKFVEFVLSPRGQAIRAEYGYAEPME